MHDWAISGIKVDMQDFRKLDVWKKSHALTLRVYSVTRAFPSDERYGLTSQIRRAAASIPANIAEGCGRGSQGQMRQFFQVSAGSASELEYHILLARDLEFLDLATFRELEQQVIEVKRMLAGFSKRLTDN